MTKTNAFPAAVSGDVPTGEDLSPHTLCFKVGEAQATVWSNALAAALPGWKLVAWADRDSADVIDYAAVWQPEPGELCRIRGLRGIISLSAGVDHLLIDQRLPDVPVVRLTGDALVGRMVEYVALHVLRHHRRLDDILTNQQNASWQPFTERPASARRVGILGLGRLGEASAKAIAQLGFDVAAWVRTARVDTPGISLFVGDADFDAFLERTDILVCLLPLTSQTENILDRSLFERLPDDAAVINVARGEHLVESDLLDAIDSGSLGAATLDVFREEPLPTNHPFWRHPKILVTPHLASLIDAVTGAPLVAAHLARFVAGEQLVDVVDIKRGY